MPLIFKKYNKLLVLLALYAVLTVFLLAPKTDFSHLFLGALCLYLSYLIIYRISKKIFIFYVVIVSILVAVLLPTILLYNGITKGMLISLFETNLLESREYLKTLPLMYFCYSLIYLLFSFTLVVLVIKQDKFRCSKRSFIFMVIVFIALSCYKPLKIIVKTPRGNLSYFYAISQSYMPLGKYVNYVHYYFYTYQNEKARIKAQSKASTWDVISFKPKYKNYVVVIGESARRDYLSVYGYSIETTPFLNTVNGNFFNNYVSPAAHTVPSLRRMLIQNIIKNHHHEIQYGNNVVALANRAGLKTYWLSNQGLVGKYDSPISILASPAQYHFYANHSNYSKSLSDRILLPVFEKSINDSLPEDQSRIIFIHLIGSHADFCSRVSKDYAIDSIALKNASQAMSCYLTSLKQTDALLKDIYTKLESKGESFSLMYFSDHGLAHTFDDSNITSLRHGDYRQSGYNVPMLVLSSDDKKRQFINAKKSGFNFVNHFAQWLGVKVRGVSSTPGFFSENTSELINIHNGDHKNYQELVKDPAFDYSLKSL